MNPSTGEVRWQRQVGAPWKPGEVGCADLAPDIGVTATPVVDESTQTAYFTSKTYASGTSGPARWNLHAVDVTTGESRPGFPVELKGTAPNADQPFTRRRSSSARGCC
jgi:hypothetical protein